MKLILADDSSAFSTFFRTEDGQPAYRTSVIARNKLSGGSTTLIHKIPLGQGATIRPEQNDGDLFGVKAHEMATFKIRSFHQDEFNYKGKDFKEDDFFTKQGLGLLGWGRDRLWNGPDGKVYRWEMGDSKPELFLDDDAKTLVAKFHREHSGFLGFHEKCPASLEIFGTPSEDLVDIIVMTFVYIEKNRADREEESNKIAQKNMKSGLKDLAKS